MTSSLKTFSLFFFLMALTPDSAKFSTSRFYHTGLTPDEKKKVLPRQMEKFLGQEERVNGSNFLENNLNQIFERTLDERQNTKTKRFRVAVASV